jgi:prepilin-type processing-associated H-X9-DG protein/prepilin-type N-terminal cleavage/methylation domain-containing protein
MKDEKHFVCVKSPAHGQGKAVCFTLIELLVVIAIITILASMLIPSLQKSREAGRTTACRNNMKTAAMAIRMYADSLHDHVVPLHTGNAGTYDPYSVKLWMTFLKELGIVYNDSTLTGLGKTYKYMCPNVQQSLYTNDGMAFYSWATNTMLVPSIASAEKWKNLRKFSSIKKPSYAFYMAETKNSPTNSKPYAFTHAYNLYNRNPDATGAAWFDLWRHGGKFNLFYFDGHVGSINLDGILSKDHSKPNLFWWGE